MIIESRTREQIRQSIGHNTGAMRTGTTTSAGSTTTMLDTNLENADDMFNGHHVQFTSGTNDGLTSIVDDYTGSSKTLTLRTATGSVASAVTYELWRPEAPPGRIHEFINRAIQDVTATSLVENTSVAHHASGKQRAFSLATAIQGVYKVSYRASFYSKLVHNCDAAWDTVDTDVTQMQDTDDFRQGGGSLRLTVAAALAAGDLMAYTAISETDLSGCTHLEFWAKSSVVTAAGDIVVELDNTAAVASPVETLNIPALVANTWTYCRVALANPHLDTAIISVGVDNVVDLGAHVLWIDGIQGVNDQSAEWQFLNGSHWTLDKGRGELTLFPEGVRDTGYSLLKLNTLERPDLLTTDADACDVDPEFVVARATAYAFASDINPRSSGSQNNQQLADFWMRRSDARVFTHPSLPPGTRLRS